LISDGDHKPLIAAVTCGYRMHVVVAATTDARYCRSWWRNSGRRVPRSGDMLSDDCGCTGLAITRAFCPRDRRFGAFPGQIRPFRAETLIMPARTAFARPGVLGVALRAINRDYVDGPAGTT
jgi:hypothetical protein